MGIINYVSIVSTPIIILIIVVNGVVEKQNIFDTFLKGAKEGLTIVLEIFPTLLGLFVAIGALRESGILDLSIYMLFPITNAINIPKEILPLSILRTVSGSASTAVAVDIMQTYGVDSLIGKIVATIMGSTETTIYTITIYTAFLRIKKTRGVLVAGLTGDVIGTLASVGIWQILSKDFS